MARYIYCVNVEVTPQTKWLGFTPPYNKSPSLKLSLLSSPNQFCLGIIIEVCLKTLTVIKLITNHSAVQLKSQFQS